MIQITEKGDGVILCPRGSSTGKEKQADMPEKYCVVHGQQEIKKKEAYLNTCAECHVNKDDGDECIQKETHASAFTWNGEG